MNDDPTNIARRRASTTFLIRTILAAIFLTIAVAAATCEPTKTTHSKRSGNVCAMAAAPEVRPGGCAHPAGHVLYKYATTAHGVTWYRLIVGKRRPIGHEVKVSRQTYAKCSLGDRYPRCAKAEAS
jgi:hypothetical protein